VKSVYETTLKTLNTRFLGPLERASEEMVPLPLVFVLGNHSSGKSSFINHMIGRPIQATGVAPTDDGFTIIAPGAVAATT
jgi:ribosome biogenesis GTPase A